jgi:outer membrane protein
MKKIFVFCGFSFLAANAMADVGKATLDLAAVFSRALLNDPSYLQAKELRNAATESESQAVAQLLPFFSVSGGSGWNYLYNKKAGYQGEGIHRYWVHQFTVNLNQPVFHWEYWVQLSQSENEIAKAEAEFHNASQDLIVRTIDAYLDVLHAKDNLSFAVAEKASLARQLKQAQQRFDVGLIAITDALEAQSGFDGAQANEIFAQNNVGNAREALREIIDEYQGVLAELPGEIPLMKPDPLDINQWAVAADNQNLDIVAGQNQVELARKAIELQRTGHYPTVDVVGDYGYTENDASFGMRGDRGSVGMQFNLPIFEGGAVNSRVREALYQFNAEKDRLLAVRRQVTRTVRNAYRGVISTISQVKALRSTVRSSTMSLEATEVGFEVGTRTMVDVVSERRNLFEAQKNLSEARNSYIMNWVTLKESASSLSESDINTLNDLLVSPVMAPAPVAKPDPI